MEILAKRRSWMPEEIVPQEFLMEEQTCQCPWYICHLDSACVSSVLTSKELLCSDTK